jgi:hypothetical protein
VSEFPPPFIVTPVYGTLQRYLKKKSWIVHWTMFELRVIIWISWRHITTRYMTAVFRSYLKRIIHVQTSISSTYILCLTSLGCYTYMIKTTFIMIIIQTEYWHCKEPKKNNGWTEVMWEVRTFIFVFLVLQTPCNEVFNSFQWKLQDVAKIQQRNSH